MYRHPHKGSSWHPIFPSFFKANVTHCTSWIALQAFGGELSHEEVEALFDEAREDGSERVGVDKLANLLQQLQLQGNLFKIIQRYSA